MNGWLIALYCVAGLAFLVVLLLILPITIRIGYDKKNGLYRDTCFCFVRLSRSRLVDKKKSKKQKKQIEQLEQQLQDRSALLATVEETLADLKETLIAALWLLQHARVSRLAVTAVCGGEDAAAVAQQYGAICALLYPFIEWLRSVMTVDDRHVDLNIGCAFDRQESEWALDFRLTFSLRLALEALMLIAETKEEES
ncbi:MAG: hypothetical protein IIX68_01280 [Clostridia bacterium]|nr:hypothetical protein [Clostridia bacterium]